MGCRGTDAVQGVHGTVPGLSLHQELGLYVDRCGFTAIEALRSATSVTAKRFSLNDRGRVAGGLKADLLMVKGDPTTDIRCTVGIARVWRGGVALEG
jgi:imidazolonepropionase-like amidohydrolase